ncbi:MAG: hypothetical protein BV458_13230, partial [Thermoplasmata archaeon M9B2D]
QLYGGDIGEGVDIAVIVQGGRCLAKAMRFYRQYKAVVMIEPADRIKARVAELGPADNSIDFQKIAERFFDDDLGDRGDKK